MIAVVDYGAGNLASVQKAFQYLKCDVVVSSDVRTIKEADGIVLPGVGAFADAVRRIDSINLRDTLSMVIRRGTPFLGICLGLQLLFDSSEESDDIGKAKGLGILKGEIKKFPNGKKLKIPHVGWNTVTVKKRSRLFKGIQDNAFFYFVHSYYLKIQNPDVAAAITEYGIEFTSSIEVGNLFATQFHPEKSGREGLNILQNFIDIVKGKTEVQI